MHACMKHIERLFIPCHTLHYHMNIDSVCTNVYVGMVDIGERAGTHTSVTVTTVRRVSVRALGTLETSENWYNVSNVLYYNDVCWCGSMLCARLYHCVRCGLRCIGEYV